MWAGRDGWGGVYDLPERVLPPELLDAAPSDAECVTHLAAVAARALGVVTHADLTDYQRLRGGASQRGDGTVMSPYEAAAAADLIPVEITGPPGGPAHPAWADPAALAAADPRRARAIPTLTYLPEPKGRFKSAPGADRETKSPDPDKFPPPRSRARFHPGVILQLLKKVADMVLSRVSGVDRLLAMS